MLLTTYLQKHVLRENKDLNVKLFSVTTRINEAKTLKH